MLDVLAGLYGRMGLLGSIVTGLIVLTFIGGFYINILIRRRYIALSQELAAFCAGEISEFKSEMLTWITDEYKASLSSGAEAINTASIIDMAMEAYLKFYVLGESFLRKVNGLLITLGLFGTFLGLTSAIGNIGNTMTETSAETLMTEAGVSTFKVLVTSFQGMSVAFITSLFGTGFSILYSIITSFISSNETRKLFVTQLEEYLDIKLLSEAMEAKNNPKNDQRAEMDVLCQSLTGSILSFNQSVRDYTEELQSLKSFNHDLGQNMEQAKQYVELLSQSLGKTSETIYQSGIEIHSCSKEFKGLIKEIHDENQRMEGMGSILSELSQRLNDSNKDRQLFLKVLCEVPDRLLNYNEAAVARIERGR